MTYFTLNRTRVELAAKHFPLAPTMVRVRQGIKLIRARQYLRRHNICAADRDSKFAYKMSTGSVLK